MLLERNIRERHEEFCTDIQVGVAQMGDICGGGADVASVESWYTEGMYLEAVCDGSGGDDGCLDIAGDGMGEEGGGEGGGGVDGGD